MFNRSIPLLLISWKYFKKWLKIISTNPSQYKLSASPPPSDEEDESSSDEDDGFGPKKKPVDDDPVAREWNNNDDTPPILSIAEAKAAAEKAQASKLLISFEFGKTLEKHTQNLY